MNRFLKTFLCLISVVALLGTSQAEKKYLSCGYMKECVPRHLCDANNNVIKDGRAIIDFRSATTGVCAWTEICCSTDKMKVDTPGIVHQECGYSNPKGLKITLEHTDNGEAQFGEFPWMVSIMIRPCERCMFVNIGGGALVAPNMVLTAAHKVADYNENNIVIRAGEWDTHTLRESLEHVDAGVLRKYIHPEFNKETGIFNVAILKLKVSINRAEHIETICLPREDNSFEDARCLVMGWGKENAHAEIYPHILKKIDLPYIIDLRCQALLRETQLGGNFKLHHTLLCAGGEEGKDACVGDGGAPLVCPLRGFPDRYQLVGIVNWGLGCGKRDVPGVYTNVQSLLPWIKDIMNRNSVSRTDYTY